MFMFLYNPSYKQATRILCLLLISCVLFSLLPVSTTAANVLPFTDVKVSDWFYDAVQYVYTKGMIRGTEADKFSPNDVLTRGMLVSILFRNQKVGTIQFKNKFQDVANKEYYANAIAWASSFSIVNGYDSAHFGPNDPVTREQMATILVRYAKSKHINTNASVASLNRFKDKNKVNDYAKEAMAWCCEKGIISGTSSTTLSPKARATRAEVATIVYRFMQNISMNYVQDASPYMGVSWDGKSKIAYVYADGNTGTTPKDGAIYELSPCEYVIYGAPVIVPTPTPAGYCDLCGKKAGDGSNGTCIRWPFSTTPDTCPSCGATVPAKACHTCGQ